MNNFKNIYDAIEARDCIVSDNNIYYSIDNFNDIANFSKNAKYIIFDAREICHTFWLPRKAMHMRTILSKVDPQKIYYIINYHSSITDDELKTEYGNINIFRSRYFEVDCVHKHDYGNLERQSLSTIFGYRKKYLALFGKPYKFMRIGALTYMDNHNMINESLYSCLSGNTDTINYAASITDYWSKDDIVNTLTKFNTTADNITYDRGTSNSDTNYFGYPYDVKMYKNTKISIIAETNDIKMHDNPSTEAFFVTEKTCRAMYNYHPFVILSTPLFLENLQKLGYKTFSNFCDESYDSEYDSMCRLTKSLQSAQELSNVTNRKITKVLVHNANNLKSVYDAEKAALDSLLNSSH